MLSCKSSVILALETASVLNGEKISTHFHHLSLLSRMGNMTGIAEIDSPNFRISLVLATQAVPYKRLALYLRFRICYFHYLEDLRLPRLI
jgi:hypothetical protein